MCEHEQLAVWGTLRKEYRTLTDELGGIKEFLLQKADEFKSRSELLRTKPDILTWCAETESAEAIKLCEALNRYRDLLAEKSAKKARLEELGEIFESLEP